MKLYVGRLAMRTRTLTLEEKGMILEMLMLVWEDGSAPVDVIEEAIGMRIEDLRPVMRAWMRIDAEGYARIPFFDAEHSAADMRSKIAASAANARWSKERMRAHSESNADPDASALRDALPYREEKKRRREERTAIAVPRATTPDEFKAQCAAVAAEHPDLLPPSLRKAFFDYWTERDAQGRMRLQAEKHFEIPRRMTTWRANAEKRGEIPAPAPERKTGWLTPDGK